MAGLEVEEIEYVGLAPADVPSAACRGRAGASPTVRGLAWDRRRSSSAQIARGAAAPQRRPADAAASVDDGAGRSSRSSLTGAPNLFHSRARAAARAAQGGLRPRGRRALRRPPARGGAHHAQARQDPRRRVVVDGLLREGAGHLRRARGHHHPAPTTRRSGMPLVDYMGDVVLRGRDHCRTWRAMPASLGVAREVAALTGEPLRQPDLPAARPTAPPHRGPRRDRDPRTPSSTRASCWA